MRSRPLRSTLLAVTATSLLLTSCADSSGGGESASGTGSPAGSLIVVTPNPVGGNNFLQLAVDGAERVAKENGLEIEVFESNDPTSIQQNVEAAVREKPAVVVGLSFSLQDVFATVPVDNPDQQFLLVDACPDPQPENVTCASFREHEAAYLAGVEAGLLTKTGKIGTVAALDTPFIRRWVDPFTAGARSVRPDVTGTALFVGGDNPFGDPARGAAQAQVLADGGVDQVVAAASGSNVGTFQVAATGAFSTYGVDTNQCADAPGHVVDNVLKNVDIALADAVEAVLAGTTGGDQVYGLKEGGVGVTALSDDVATSGCLIAEHPDVIAEVEAVQQQIIDGTLVVDDPAAG
ncbi:basic membrane lipoprotein [Kineococcus radiotolerans SRS30216 = ATCC BAA-149]|uniref:Basic membrane lipoprotein n=1 Tax=Kineococcus radiotolerans (strain ATCC BAA-149 / DSM 14245 / SRS30216) TaxID=266940 RepID=A6W9W6_KINRD|nr:basic membrane lipoprotein [Kineococcus radiotolerans SRS30216 = ATCC BAA-149]